VYLFVCVARDRLTKRARVRAREESRFVDGGKQRHGSRDSNDWRRLPPKDGTKATRRRRWRQRRRRRRWRRRGASVPCVPLVSARFSARSNHPRPILPLTGALASRFD
jgi:hypothetical protein